MRGDDRHGASLEARTQAFLAEFFNRGQELVRDLMEENEALKSRLRTLESDRDPTAELVANLRQQIAELEDECEKLRRMAGSVEQPPGDYQQRLEELEAAHYHLAARQVSAEQLRRCGSLDEAVRATTEILLNLVGIGSFAVYGVDERRRRFFPLAVEGRGSLQDLQEVGFDPGPGSTPGLPLHVVAGVRNPWRQEHGLLGSAEGTLMVLPLVCEGRLVAAVHLQRFLPQKQGFTDDDLALLELLSEESGAALEAAWMRAHARDVELTRSALEGLLT